MSIEHKDLVLPGVARGTAWILGLLLAIFSKQNSVILAK